MNMTGVTLPNKLNEKGDEMFLYELNGLGFRE